MNIAIRRVGTDWAALCLRELRGDEPPGSVANELAKATGHKPAAEEGDVGVTVNALLRLAESLRVPNDVKKQIADLDRAAQGSKTAAAAAKSEQAKLAAAQHDLANERAMHEAAIERELKEHASKLAAGHAEVEAAKKLAVELRAKAEADALAAQELKRKFEKKIAMVLAD